MQGVALRQRQYEHPKMLTAEGFRQNVQIILELFEGPCLPQHPAGKQTA